MEEIKALVADAVSKEMEPNEKRDGPAETRKGETLTNNVWANLQ